MTRLYHFLLWATITLLPPLAWAGTPNHLMWVGKDQDALILGEVVGKPSPLSNTVRVMAVFPQTTPVWRDALKPGERLKVNGIKLPLSGKYLLSLKMETSLYRQLHDNPAVMEVLEAKREVEGKYIGIPLWGAVELTPASTGFTDAQLAGEDFLRDDLQLLVSTEGKYLTPADLFADDLPLKQAQIPANLLKQIPTRELVRIWLAYPHSTLVYAYSSPQQGMDKLRWAFNGLQELLQRKDAADETLALFREQDLSSFKPDMGETNIADFIRQQAAITLLLAQPEISGQLAFYQRYYLRWQVSQRIAAMEKTPVLQISNALASYRLLADALQN